MPDVNDIGFDEWVGGYGGGFDYFTKIWPNNISAPCWYHNRTPISDNRDWPIFRFPMRRRSMGNLVLKTCRTANYSYGDAKGKWVHRVVGMGHGCPEGANVLGFLITGNSSGTYHFYLDNIMVRRRDGSRVVIWQQGMPVAGALAPPEITGLRVNPAAFCKALSQN